MVQNSEYLPDAENPIDEYVLERIRYRVVNLLGRFGFRRCDEEDLRQELILHVLQAAKRFDPSKGSWPTYLNRTLDKQVRAIILRATHQPDTGPMIDVSHFADSIPGQLTDEGLALEIKTAIESLPEELRKVCEQLKCGDLNQTSRALGIRRRTLKKHILSIRRHFEEAGVSAEHLAA